MEETSPARPLAGRGEPPPPEKIPGRATLRVPCHSYPLVARVFARGIPEIDALTKTRAHSGRPRGRRRRRSSTHHNICAAPGGHRVPRQRG
eukprot:scaffold2565_cov384-Prasinococcus_capsulatus_cf.AAC.4